jgi:hypothetical protein
MVQLCAQRLQVVHQAASDCCSYEPAAFTCQGYQLPVQCACLSHQTPCTLTVTRTPIINIIYSMLGMKIGWGVMMDAQITDGHDLIEVREGSALCSTLWHHQ